VNGNITDLYRTSIAEYGNTTATLIDKLKYDYDGNQTTHINDYSYNDVGYAGGGQLIKYDLNGNMTGMPDKGIDAIKYNYLNLSNFLHLNRNGIEDIIINTKYNANGTKLRKENSTMITGIAGSTTTKTTVDYLDGFQYSKTESPNTGGGDPEMFSARAMEPEAFSVEPNDLVPMGAKTADLQFLPTAEGFYDYINDQYIYQYKDHLGNVRVSFARNSAGALQIKDNNDYYPFGMNHLKTGNAYFGAGSYKNYKYNKKELQETGLYDYGWREYMPDIGRWNGIDQLAEKYISASPYAYVLNNTINMFDPDGRQASSTGVKMNKNGSYTVVDAKNDGDKGVYVVDEDGNYDINSSEKIAETMTPYDFMMTDDTTGEFFYDKKLNITFNLNKLGITANVEGNRIINGDANGLLRWGQSIYTNALLKNNIDNSNNALFLLALLSRNKAVLDFKVSLGIDKYTPVQNGTTDDGLPILTTLRAVGNIVFGANMNIAQNFSGQSEMSFYQFAMPFVGFYNQFQNNKKAISNPQKYYFNPGFPYYGEHTYSGSYIYMGYWKHFYKK
jgi:RHS repeat-associated protein